MDIATIVGLIAAITCLMVGFGPNLSSLVNPAALIIVVGGTMAATLIANPLVDVVNLVAIYMRAIFLRVIVPTKLIQRIVGFTETARSEGIPGSGERDQDRRRPFSGRWCAPGRGGHGARPDHGHPRN